MQRIFLGWDRPFLPTAVEWLWDRYGDASGCDLSGLVAVVPGRRAGRRLLELLAQRAEAGPRLSLLVPPAVVTVGGLPEILYPSELPCASPLTSLLARVATLRRADPKTLGRIVPRPPEAGDLRGWVDLAQEINRVWEAVAEEGMAFDEVEEKARAALEFPDSERWQALAALQREYAAFLQGQGFQDLQEARLHAVSSSLCQSEREIVLLATPDLGRLVRQMLEQVAARVTALIHAPKEEAVFFDEWGCLVVDKWVERKLNVASSRVRVVDHPGDQAAEVLRIVLEATRAGTAPRRGEGGFEIEEISVGLGDPRLAPAVEHGLALAGVPAHSAVGRPFLQTRPAQLLAAFGHYVGRRRFDHLAGVIRHPDLAQLLGERIAGLRREKIGSSSPDLLAAAQQGDWLTVVDLYAQESIPVRLGPEWPGDPLGSETVRLLDEALWELYPGSGVDTEEASTRRPLPAWCPRIAALLATVYGGDRLDPTRPEALELISALALVGDLLREQAALDPADAATPMVNAAQALELVLSLLAQESLPSEPRGPAVEVLGWLELALDDAPAVIVTGLNEGALPSSVNGDVILPNRLRRAVGLPDNDRRYGRDLMILTALLASGRAVALIAGRRSAEDEPLAPSRLLLACAAERLPEAVLRFYGGEEGEGDGLGHPLLVPYAEASQFVIPKPEPLAEPVVELPVTAFRDYLRCPYRFYLKWVLQLQAVGARPRELDGAAFGRLAHEVLRRFGMSEAARSAEPRAIQNCLFELLESLCAERFGPRPAGPVLVQIRQLRRRLAAFAQWQATENAAGWRIQSRHLEQRLGATLKVDGEPFTIIGRIDRIDHHPAEGFRILDYKTGEEPRSPEEVHRRGTVDGGGEWIDLQLPLYRVLAEAAGLAGPIRLGFVFLPRELGGVGVREAEWSEELVAEAVEQARDVVRQIRRGVFWPPAEPARFDDGLGWICGDESPDRPALVRRSS